LKYLKNWNQFFCSKKFKEPPNMNINFWILSQVLSSYKAGPWMRGYLMVWNTFLLISWCQIYLCKFLEFQFHGYKFHSMFSQGYMCKFWIFFMVTWITFLDHMCHFSWLQIPIFMIASVLFHADMLSQNLQPTSQKRE